VLHHQRVVGQQEAVVLREGEVEIRDPELVRLREEPLLLRRVARHEGLDPILMVAEQEVDREIRPGRADLDQRLERFPPLLDPAVGAILRREVAGLRADIHLVPGEADPGERKREADLDGHVQGPRVVLRGVDVREDEARPCPAPPEGPRTALHRAVADLDRAEEPGA